MPQAIYTDHQKNQNHMHVYVRHLRSNYNEKFIPLQINSIGHLREPTSMNVI